MEEMRCSCFLPARMSDVARMPEAIEERSLLMLHLDSAVAGIEKSQWPNCPTIGGVCLTHDLAEALGGNILESLMTFVMEAEQGARLILQSNRDGFSLQFTGPVQRNTNGKPGLEELRILRGKIDMMYKDNN